MASTKVIKCICKSEFQDKIYGEGKRLHNMTSKQNNTVARCTVCSKENNISSTPSSKKKN